MRHHIATIGLGPLLLLQGMYVRRVTPRLPEPDGPRSGVSGSGSPLRLLIVGDSAAAGVGASSQEAALAGRLASALSPHFSLSWELEAKTGRTTEETLHYLEALPEREVDIVITSLGVNDVTGQCSLKKWLALQEKLVQLLHTRFRANHVFLSALPPVHLFPVLPQPLRWYLGAQAMRFNTALAAWAELQERCSFVPLQFPLEPSLMATDGFHPGPGAYEIWAGHLAGKVRTLQPAMVTS